MFLKIANVLMVGGIICVVWELVLVARTIAGPDPSRMERILEALADLHFDLERISLQLLELKGSPSGDGRKHIREIVKELKTGNGSPRPLERS